MKIHEIAKQCQTTVATIRHYERLGLLTEQHVTRTPNGYRNYSRAAVDRILLIKTGQRVGFGLRYMAQELHNWDDDLDPSTKKNILRRQLEAIDQQLTQLQQTRRFIETEMQKNC